MAQAQYGTLITNIGLAKIANAQITQSKVGLECIALGDGNGAHYVPTTNQTALVNEVWRGPVAEVSIDPKNNNRIIIDAVIPVTVGGFTIREIGVFNDEGHLIAVGQYPEKYKPQLNEGVSEETIIHFVIETNNANVVKLNIDPTVIIASKDYVDKKFDNLNTRIGDTNKLETDYKEDTVGAINEVNDELSKLVENVGFKEPKSAVLESVANIVDAPIKTLSAVTELEGRTITNLVPLFDSGLWTLHANTTMTSSKRIGLYPTADSQVSRISIPAKPLTTYTLTVKHTGVIAIDALVDLNDTKNTQLASGAAQTYTVTTLADTKYVRVYLHNGTSRALSIFDNVALYEGTEALPFVANVQGITNPTIENLRHNLVPMFNMNNNAPELPGWMYLDVIDNNGGGSWTGAKNARVMLQVVPNKKYTFSCYRKAKVKITTNKGSNWDDDQLTTLFEESTVQNSYMSCTFTVPADVNFIRILFETIDGGYVSGPTLVKGTVPAPYKEQVREMLTLKTTLYGGDQLKLDATGQLVKRSVKGEALLNDNGNLKYTLYHQQAVAGGKLVQIEGVAKYISLTNPAIYTVKYNGTLLAYGGHTSFPDRIGYWIEQDRLYISIANADSGWGPNYSPTADEIKAYFLGWKMYRGDNPTETEYAPYDGTGQKVWALRWTPGCGYSNNRGLVIGTGTTILPTISAKATAFPNTSWQPYKLVYELQTPITEVVETSGSLTLDEGENTLVISEGRIVQEVVAPFFYHAVTETVVYNRYEINTRSQNPLEHNTALILQVCKNGKPDPMWTLQFESIGYMRAFLEAPYFDPTAVYTVDYVPLEPYKITAPTNPITINYAENFGSAMQLLVTKTAEIGTRMSNMEQKQAFRFGKDDGGVYIIIDEEALT